MVDARNVIAQVRVQLKDAERVEDVQQVVKVAARQIAGAHGATFVLLDGDMCYYADEDSMSPLWKGQRFPRRRLHQRVGDDPSHRGGDRRHSPR